MSYTVELPETKPISEALAWAKNNCRSYITNTGHFSKNPFEVSVVYTFYFSEAKDATWFTVRWL